MESEVLGPVRAFKEGCEAFAKRPIFTFFSTAVWLALSIEGWSLWIDWGRALNYSAINALTYAVPIAIYVLLAFPLMGGVMTSFLSAARGSRPTLADYLAGVKAFAKWWRMGGRAMAMTALLYVLIGIVYSLLSHEAAVEGMAYRRLFLTVVAALTLALTLFTGWPFGWFALVEATSPSEALKACAAVMRGRTLRTVLSACVIACGPPSLLALGIITYRMDANAFGVPGWIAFLTGVVLLTAIALNGMAALYVHLTPAAEHGTATTTEKAA